MSTFHALGINARNLLGIAPRNGAEGIGLARDKVATKQRLEEAGVAVPRTMAVIEDMWGIPEVAQAVQEPAVIKPAAGSGGGGVLLLAPDGQGFRTPSGRWLTQAAVERHAAEILHGGFSYGGADRVLIETRLHAHPQVAGLHGEGIADVRVIFVDGHQTLSMLRMPTEESEGRANLHQGGVAAPLDGSGRLGKVFDGRKFDARHPDGALVEGVRLPFWIELCAVARKAAEAFPLEWSGIDLVITPDGPVVLEVNARPGLAIQNVNRKSMVQWL